MRRLCFALVSVAMLGQPVLAKPHLREVSAINDSLVILGIANRIRKNCPTISARKVKAIGFIQGIQSQALAMGYSQAEIDAYADSEPDKQRLRAKAARFLTAQGVDPSNPQSYCAVGLKEIQKSSQIGALLKAK